MGKSYIEGFLEQEISRTKALEIHLQCNHYPPVSLKFVPCALDAINACEDYNSSADIDMPNGLTKKAYEIVEGLHLDSFLQDLYNE